VEEHIHLGKISLIGDLKIPKHPLGLVIFAHGSGSGRKSPRNRLVARVLNEAGIATLLVDLLTEEEGRVDEITREFRFNIELLAERLEKLSDWAVENEQTKLLSIAYFGASTGAAAALIAAAKKGALVKAVVSRGGRPDLAVEQLPRVQSATLLIVGELDTEVILLNREAYGKLSCLKKLEIVPGATHLFEEEGCLEKAAQLACEWFKTLFRSI
jgi:Dienelactone hydrolase and related enzymes